MREEEEAVHVHCLDEKAVIEEYRKRGFKLERRTRPTIITQKGFVKLIFIRPVAVEVSPNPNVYLG